MGGAFGAIGNALQPAAAKAAPVAAKAGAAAAKAGKAASKVAKVRPESGTLGSFFRSNKGQLTLETLLGLVGSAAPGLSGGTDVLQGSISARRQNRGSSQRERERQGELRTRETRRIGEGLPVFEPSFPAISTGARREAPLANVISAQGGGTSQSPFLQGLAPLQGLTQAPLDSSRNLQRLRRSRGGL